MNMILFGFKSCGKTTLGRMTAASLQVQFIDLDSVIESIYSDKNGGAGLSFREIYSRHGREFFRTLETEATASLAGFNNSIISTGGGTVLNPDNLQLLKEVGKLVYLEVDFEIAAKRILRPGKIPAFLTSEDPRKELENLYTERCAVYKTIYDLSVHVSNLSDEQKVEQLQKAFSSIQES
jgi:shikimate kinase